jgi:microcystin-dependent protein
MADPFVAEIRAVPFNFAPVGWAFCDGQLLPLSQNTALFSLLGTTYGGDGKSTFALPDLKGFAPIHFGQGPGLENYTQGQFGGAETVTLLESEIPLHTHGVMAAPDPADQQAPASNRSLARSKPGNAWQSDTAQNVVQTAPETLTPSGGGLPHNNLPPVLFLHFIIALQGVFPARS